MLIGTHPHADHIGQIDKVLQNLKVSEVWMSGDSHTTATFERVIDAILQSDASYHEPRTGESFTIGSSSLEVVNPNRLTGDLHEGSISVMITFGEVKFLFTGDAEHETEKAMLNRGHDLQAHIFQLGHHGSSTSNTRSFLEKVQPDVAIYSAGQNNRYGHPHTEVVDRVLDLGIKLYGTDVHGHILIQTDGQTYSIKTQKSETITGANEQVKDEGTERVTSDTGSRSDDTNDKDVSRSTDYCIDINSASKQQLMDIVHIGEARADELISLRPFDSIDQLSRIRGIGDARLNDIKSEGIACVK